MSFEEIYKKRGLEYKPYSPQQISPQQIPSTQDAFAQIKARQAGKQKLEKFEGMFEQGAELHEKAVEAAGWKSIIRETAKGIPDAFPKVLKTLATPDGIRAMGRGSVKGLSLGWLNPKTPEEADEIEKSIEAGWEIAGHLGAFMTGEAALKLAFKTPVIAAKLGSMAPKIAYISSWMGTTQLHKELRGAGFEERAKRAAFDAATILAFEGVGYGFKKGIEGVGKGLTKYKYQIVPEKTIKGAFWKIFEDLPRQLEQGTGSGGHSYSKEAAKIIRGLDQSKVKTVDEGIKLIRKSLSTKLLKTPGVEYSILNFQQHANNQINGVFKDIFTKSLSTSTAVPIVKLAEKIKPTKFKPGLKSIEKPIDFKITPEAEIKALKSIQKEFPGIKSINEQIESLEKGIKPEVKVSKISKKPEIFEKIEPLKYETKLKTFIEGDGSITKKLELENIPITETLKKINKNMGFFHEGNISVKQLAKEYGDFNIAIKDVNGQRALVPVSEFLEWSKSQAFRDRVKEVFINSNFLSKLKRNVDKEFMEALMHDEKIFTRIGEDKLIDIEKIKQELQDIKLVEETTISFGGKAKFIEAITDKDIIKALKDNGIKEIRIQPPYRFSLSEQANINKQTKVLCINADAVNPKQTIQHEIGHLLFDNLNNSQKKVVEKILKDNKIGINYLKIGKIEEAFADNYFTNKILQNFYNKTIKPVTKVKPLTKPSSKVKPTAQDYSKWVKKQPEAMKEFKDIQAKIAKIKDVTVKRTFIKKEQSKFETKYSEKFYKVFPKMKLAKPKTTIGKTRALAFNPKNLLHIKTKVFKKETDKLIKRSEISKMLSEKLNVPIRRGKFRGKALGIYKPSSKTVRIKKGNIPVISHEVGHFLDDTLGLSKTINKEEMIKLTAEYAQKPLSRMNIKDKNQEALAEFIRYYITDPLKAKKEAPIYSSYFEKVMEKFPEIKDVLLVARQDYKRWTEMPSVAKVLSQVSFEKEKKGIKEKFSKNVKDFYIDIKDDLYPLKIFSNLAKKFIPGVSNDELPYMLARIIRGRLGTANTFLEKGTFNKSFWTEPGKKFKFDFTGKGLGEILKPISIKGIMNEFNIFLVSLRVLELSKRNILTGIEKKDALMALKELRSKYPEFVNTAKEVYKFQDAVLKYGWESGLFSSELLIKLKLKNRFFVPFYRVIEELESGGYFGKGYVNVSNTLKRMKGSELDIINPLESIVKNTYAIINASERNTVGSAMANLAKKHYQLAREFEKIDIPMAKVATVKKSDLSKALLTDFEKMGFQTKEVEGIIDIFRPSLFLPKENVLTVLVKGKKHYFQVDPMLYKSLMALDRTHTGIVIKLLSQPTRWLRAGAILTPEFMMRNPLRDLFGAFVFSKYGIYTPIDFVKGMFSLLQKDDYYWAWRASGGEHSMFVSMDREYLQKNIKEIIHGKGFKDYFKNPLEMLRVFSEFSEIPTRLGEFRKGIAKGVSPLEASYASREITLDFAKMGTTGKAINNLVVFWNAWAEGWDKLVRTFKHHPTRTTSRVIMGITTPSIILYMVNRKDPRWKEIPQWKKDLFWIFFSEKHTFYLWKPFQLGVLFGSIPERILEHLDTKDPEMMDRLAQNILSSQTPGIQPTFLEPLVENWANYDFFLDKPVVPASKTALPAEAQYTAYTSETAKMLGKTINYSPAKLENLFRGYFGGLGQHFINASDKILKGIGISSVVEPEPVLADKMVLKAFVMRRPIGNASASVEKFYDKYKKYESRERLLKQYITLGEKEKYYAYKAKYPELYFKYDYKRNVYFSIPAREFRKVAALISELRKKEAQVYASKTLNAIEKREKITELDIEITKYAKRALEYDIKK